jgi:purine-binding chemotaxis protein CheW
MTENAILVNDQALVATFDLGPARFGIEASRIQEIIRVPEVTPVYRADGYILGIINLRGRIVTVIDLARKLGIPTAGASEANRIVIVDWGGEYVGFLVEKVNDVVIRDSVDLQALPANVDEVQEAFIAGVFPAGGHLVSLLKVDPLLAVEARQAEDAGVPAPARA